MELKELIKQRRLDIGLSQEGLAKRLGVSRQTIQQWESGFSAPRRKRLSDLAEALDMSPASIDPFAGDSSAIALNEQRADTIVPFVDFREISMDYDAGDFQSGERVVTDWPADNGVVAFHVGDDSMMPVYAPGEVVIASRNVTAEDGDDVVAQVDGVNVLRRYRPRGPHAFDLVPLADNYATVTINEDQPGLVLMTVVEHRWRRRK